MNESKSVLNTKCNSRYCTEEYLIKEEDSAQDMSRAGILKRSVLAAVPIDDWMPAARHLAELELEEKAPQFSNFQAEMDADTREKLDGIKKKMQKSLVKGGIITKVLQTQYMLQLLGINYLESLRESKLLLKAKKIDEDKIGLPEMSAIFVEMMLTNRECAELEEIRSILIDWRRKNEESV